MLFLGHVLGVNNEEGCPGTMPVPELYAEPPGSGMPGLGFNIDHHNIIFVIPTWGCGHLGHIIEPTLV